MREYARLTEARRVQHWGVPRVTLPPLHGASGAILVTDCHRWNRSRALPVTCSPSAHCSGGQCATPLTKDCSSAERSACVQRWQCSRECACTCQLTVLTWAGGSAHRITPERSEAELNLSPTNHRIGGQPQVRLADTKGGESRRKGSEC